MEQLYIKVVQFIFTTIIAAAVASILIDLINDKEIYTGKTSATVTSYEMEQYTSGFIFASTHTKRNIKITYTVEDKVYNATLNVYAPYEKGDMILIKYIPEDPTVILTEEDFSFLWALFQK